MKRLITLLILLAPFALLAAVANLSWTNATKNVDGSSIPATGAGSLTNTVVEYGSCVGTAFGTKLGEISVAGTVLSATVPGLAPGTYCFRAKHVNTYAEPSDWSTVVSKTYAAPKPNPPENFSIG